MSDKREAGWLAEAIAEASSNYAMSFAPDTVTAALLSGAVSTPLSDIDAGKLCAKLAERYRAWTGRDLGADLRTE